MVRCSLIILVALPLVAVFAGLTALPLPRPSQAAFHFAVIDEVLTSYGGDANVQFVEIRMLSTSQTAVADSVLAAFDTSGNYIDDVLVVPSNLTFNTEVRWLMGTTQFQTASGVPPDFIMPAGLPSGGGMICWGAPGGVPPSPPNWDRTVMTNYIDCVAYGTYSGPSNVHIGTPTALDADGHSLQRTGDTNNNAADFACGDPADPTNHSSLSASLPATSPCTPPTPTLTSTPTPTPTPTPKDPSGDTDGDTVLNSDDPDDDNDGCTDEQELGDEPLLGGRRNPHNFWDFFDADQDGAVAFGDFLLFVQHFGTNDVGGTAQINRNSDPLTTPDLGPGSYHPLVDRGAVLGPNPWNVGPPDGAIGFGDFLALVSQFGHRCA